MDKFAAIDLGTNTFHLLIASFDDKGKLIEHFRDRRYIHLAKDGIETISEDAFSRAIHCITDFHKHLIHYNIRNVTCMGTAALRTATNGQELVNQIQSDTGLTVTIIDGIKEARYIYEGVKLAVPATAAGNHVIMDIGGGSVEFIVIRRGHFYWSNSYPIGIAVLKRLFHKNDPITEKEIAEINQFLESHLKKFIHTVTNMEIDGLIGASGSFEVLAGMHKAGYTDQLSTDIPIPFFGDIYTNLINTTNEERLARTDIPNDRVALVIVAFHLMKYIIDKVKFKRIIVSAYAMKEGILSEMRNF